MSRYLTLLFIILIMIGCASKNETNDIQVLAQKEFSNRITSSEKHKYDWWKSFNSKELENLINLAIKDNFNMQTALLKIKEADLQYKKDRTTLFPHINLTADYSRTKTKQKGFPTITTNQYSLGLNTSYEIDLWGKIREGIKITELNKLEQLAAFDTATITVSSEVAKNWLNILSIRERRKILKEQILFTEQKLNVLKANYVNNLATLNDYISTNQQLINYRNELVQLDAEENISLNQLKLLVGKSSAEDLRIKSSSLPKIPPLLDIGIPADLLNNRPDVKTAQIKLFEAYSNIKLAKADRLPKLTLSANFNYNSNKISTIFDNWLFNLAANLAYPLIDYRKRALTVEIAKIQKDEAFLNYKNTVYTAIKEVEDAFINLRKSKEILNMISEQIESEKKKLKNIENDYLAGKTNSISILSTKISLLGYQKNYEEARLNYFLNLISLYKAAGGKYYEKLFNIKERKK
ncbi:TolC family protein [Deferribacter autotrophicus]|uniref:TolC family protein n=1 Tax=Deferribacter autotrophicus TaxID=500465 RepID=A0A5A8F7K7_9BACT|nr:TolC family protein [Deferribacter autotrophicus]KAA0259038.1 TolC family protein [Deferribacter autotrophicus]